MELREYQKESIRKIFADLCENQTSLLVLPCGLGKTEVFIAMIKEILEKRPKARICVLLNKIQLLEQTIARVEKELGEVSVYCGSLNKKCLKANIVIASIQSISKVDAHFELIICDEAHISLSQEYFNFFDRCKKANNKIKFVGFTATPYRQNEKIYGKDEFYKNICYQIDILTAINKGYLVKPIMAAPSCEFDTKNLRTVMGDFDKKQVNELVLDQNKSDDQICDALNRTVERKKILWFCASIEHAKLVSENLFRYGEDNAIYHSEMNYDERKLAEQKFENTECRHLVFITICVQGYNYPPCDCLVMLRPTKSIAMYIQVVGRTLRPYPGKINSLILDYGQVIKNCGPLDKPFLKSNKYEKLTLEDREQRLPVKVCPCCFHYVDKSVDKCELCGHEFQNVVKLSFRPENKHGLFSNSEEEIINIVNISLEKYISKSNNVCLRINYDYRPFGFIDSIAVFSEYFALHSEFAVRKLDKRYEQIIEDGIAINNEEYLDMYERNEIKIVFRLPKKMILINENKYRKIKKLIF